MCPQLHHCLAKEVYRIKQINGHIVDLEQVL